MALFTFSVLDREAPYCTFDEAKSTNIMALAKAKLGLK